MFNGIATVIVGWMGVNKGAKLAEDWFQCGMSILGTALVTFLGIFGAAGLGAMQAGAAPWACFMTALFVASGSTAAAVLALWKRSTLTKDIPILAPMQTEKQVLETGFAYTEPSQPKGGKS